MRVLLRPVLDESAAAPWWRRIDPAVAAEYGVVALIALFYLGFKTYAQWLRSGDEHIYFAMARAVGDGAIPYRDFFFAHPPVHLLVPAIIFRIFGFSYPVAFWIAPLASLAAGLGLWRLVRRFAPPWAAVLAMVLFVFGRTVLQSGSHLTGVNIGLAFLVWGGERLAADRPRAGGTFLGLAVLSGLYFLPASVGILMLHGLFRPMDIKRSVVLFALVGMGGFVAFDLLSGGNLFEQAVWYHGEKVVSAASPTFDSTKGQELFHNWGTFLGTLVGGAASLVTLAIVAPEPAPAVRPEGSKGRRRKGPRGGRSAPPGPSRRSGALAALEAALRDPPPAHEGPQRGITPAADAGVVAWLAALRLRVVEACRRAPWAALGVAGALWVGGHWIFLATLKIIWRYYWAVVFVGASVATAMTAVAVWRGLRTAGELIRSKAPRAGYAPVAFAVVVAAVYGAFYRHDLDLGRKYRIWGDEEAGEEKAEACVEASCIMGCVNKGNVGGFCDPRTGCECRYGWVDSPAGWVPRWFDSLVRRIWWGGDVIPAGARYSSIENTLWHESRGAPVEERYLDAAEAVADRACPGDTIFGDSGTAPMLANLTGLRVAGNVFDTNHQRFATGYIDPGEMVDRIRADGVRFVVLGWRSRDASGKDTYRNAWTKLEPVERFLGDFERMWPPDGEAPFEIVVLDRKGAPVCGL